MNNYRTLCQIKTKIKNNAIKSYQNGQDIFEYLDDEYYNYKNLFNRKQKDNILESVSKTFKYKKSIKNLETELETYHILNHGI